MTLRRRSPRAIATALDPLSSGWAPQTLLADVQRIWADAVGEAIADEAAPVAERTGVVTVACSASVWAHELELMGPTLLSALNAHLGGPRVTRLKCVVRTV